MASSEQTRAPLTRDHVLSGAVRYVDEHGLEALSMHKLGAELGVKAMSLYKHVTNKGDLLDGIVEQLWTEIPIEPTSTDWRRATTGLAVALRDLVHRHPRSAPLLTARQTLQQRPLEICDALLKLMRGAGVPEQCAVALLRTVLAYGIGFALAELPFSQPDSFEAEDEVTRIRRVTNLLPSHASDDLVRTALLVGYGCDTSSQFDIGLDLMIRGLDAYLDTTATLPASRAN